MNIHGWFEHVARDASGKVLWTEIVPNGTTTAGINDMLNVYFGASTQRTSWYIGLIDNASYSAVAVGDTASSHAGWIENNGYSGNRPAWSVGAAAGGLISNATPIVFTITVTGTVLRGTFCSSASSGTSGMLYSTSVFSNSKTMNVGDTLTTTYRNSLTAA